MFTFSGNSSKPKATLLKLAGGEWRRLPWAGGHASIIVGPDLARRLLSAS